jgi:hypothetical protein
LQKFSPSELTKTIEQNNTILYEPVPPPFPPCCYCIYSKKPVFSNSVRLAIRKLTYTPAVERPQPMVDVNKEFLVSPGLLHLEASLDKEVG